jgi:processive 1,2-diacylglycerol beta-glucosyltransferase
MIENTLPRVVVAFTPYPWTHALVTLRIVKPLQLAGIQVLHGNEKSLASLENISLADAVVIQREFVDNLELYEKIITRARQEDKPVIFEIDDLLLELPDSHPDRSINYYTPSLFSILRAIVEADLVTTTSPYLEAYLRPFNPNTRMLPNYLDDTTWKMPARRETPEPAADHRNYYSAPIVIGYMGSNTHLPDLQMIAPALEDLLNRYQEKLSLKFWGGEPPPGIRQHPNVSWIPLEIPDYAQFADYFSEQKCDIFIAPLVDTPFNRSKSPIKFFEYSILGVPGIYSRIPPYEDVIHHGQNGFLASTTDEWISCLENLIENPSIRFNLGQCAQQDVEEKWLLSGHTHEWRTVYGELFTRPRKRVFDNNPLSSPSIQVFVHVASQVRDWQNKLNRQLIQKDQVIFDLQKRIGEQEQTIQALRNAAGEGHPNSETNSRTWRLAKKIQSVRLFLIPEKSRRERWLQRWLR